MTVNPGYFFDNVSDGMEQSYQHPRHELYSLDLDDPANEKDILSWLQSELGWLEQESQARIRTMRRNLALYKGVQYQELESRIDARDRGNDRAQVVKKVVSNQLFDMTKNRAARIIKYKPAVAILPTNDELQDKVASKVTKQLLDHIWYSEDFEGKIQLQIVLNALVMGESYLFIEWDEQKGDLNPAYVEAKKKHNGKIPLLDENGKITKDPQGNEIYIDRPVRVGDVCYDVVLASEVLCQRKKKWSEVNYLFKREVIHVQELRTRYPDKASKIKNLDGAQVYDYEKMELRPSRNEQVVYTFYHRRSSMMDKGRQIVFIKDQILENKEFPFSHTNLPCERFTDIDLPGELSGVSFFENVKPLTGTYNNLTNMLVRNIVLASHPKWMVPAGSVALDQLGNDMTIVQFKGPAAPVLATATTVPSDVFQFREKLREEFLQIAGVGQVSRGEPPPGIKAGVALQFLAEQEAERYNELVLKYNDLIVGIAKMTLAVAADYYDESDERLIRVIGKNNEWMTKFFNVAYLEKDYDIRVMNSSALPRSIAARTQTLLDLSERFPDQFTGEQVIDMLDLAQSDKFIDAATIAVRAAQAENEELIKLGPEMVDEAILAPQDFENHIIHWREHTRAAQEYSFKYQTPKQAQDRLINHIKATEMLMVEHSKTNPAYAQQLATLPLFPMFFKTPPPMPPMPPEMPLGADQSMLGGMGQGQEMAGPEAMQGQQMPVNPQLGGEPQAPTLETMPPVDMQMGSNQPIPPTGGI
jgi:hypothetical protein